MKINVKDPRYTQKLPARGITGGASVTSGHFGRKQIKHRMPMLFPELDDGAHAAIAKAARAEADRAERVWIAAISRATAMYSAACKMQAAATPWESGLSGGGKPYLPRQVNNWISELCHLKQDLRGIARVHALASE